jgi:hypothetical protein
VRSSPPVSEAFETTELADELHRVGREPDPWAWIDWVFAGADGTFGGRWDDAYGRYRVLYASSQRLGAFVESLAQFRADPHVVAEYENIEGVDEDGVLEPGVLPRVWCSERVITKGVSTEVIGPFVVVGAARTIATLREAFASLVIQYGLDDLDAAAIRLSVPRAFTQELSSYFEAQIDDSGQAYAGIYFLSKHGDDFENWAIFEQERMHGQSPIMSVHRENPDPDDDDLRSALELLQIRMA